MQQLSGMLGDLLVLGQIPYHERSSSFVLPFLGSGGVLGLYFRSFLFLSSVFLVGNQLIWQAEGC